MAPNFCDYLIAFYYKLMFFFVKRAKNKTSKSWRYHKKCAIMIALKKFMIINEIILILSRIITKL